MNIYKVLMLMILPLSPVSQLIGERTEIDLDEATQRTKTALGAITSPITRKFILPLPNKKKLLTLTTTEAFSKTNYLDRELVNIPMEVLFVGSAPDAEGYKEMRNAVYMIKVYRRMQGKTLWNEPTIVAFSTTLDKFNPLSLTIHPNGVISFMKPDGNRVTLNLGKA